jgi:hypothetical protein
MSFSVEQGQPSPWIPDPEFVVFSSGYTAPVGVAEQHGPGEVIERLFRKSAEEVKANWLQVVEQMRYFISNAETLAGNYELSEVEFKLGFTAAGTIVFIAQAGVEATISATFKRKEKSADGSDASGQVQRPDGH